MNRFTLNSRVVSGFACLALAVVGVCLSGGDRPVIHDGNSPRTTAGEAQHLDQLKVSNPVLSSLDL